MVLRDGEWKKISEWKDIHALKTEWTGKSIKAEKVKIIADTMKEGQYPLMWKKPCITEIEMK